LGLVIVGNTAKKFGDLLRDLCEKNNVSREELANYLDVSPATISNYYNNKSEPKYEDLKKIADRFQVTIDFLLGRENAEKHFFTGTELTTEEQRMMDQFLKESEALIRSKGNVTEAQLRKILKIMAIEFGEDLIEERSKNK
jgi:transcriptional regulator with XRE-family HTH domain